MDTVNLKTSISVCLLLFNYCITLNLGMFTFVNKNSLGLNFLQSLTG